METCKINRSEADIYFESILKPGLKLGLLNNKCKYQEVMDRYKELRAKEADNYMKSMVLKLKKSW